MEPKSDPSVNDTKQLLDETIDGTTRQFERPPVPHSAPPHPKSIAPVWHTLLLIALIILLSFEGAKELSGKHAVETNRLQTYWMTSLTDVIMLAWVFIGLRIRRIPFRSLLGNLSGGIRTLLLDFGVAFLFWIGSLFVLGTIGILWTVTKLAVQHRALFAAGQHLPPDPAQQKLVHTLTALVPTNGHEIIAWGVVCLVAGFTEELVFRGYFQQQFTAWGRGAIAVGVIFSAIMFGAAHGYQGIRNMVLLTIFGVLFSLLAIFRRSLRAGMIAHAWHDFCMGLLLAAARWKHLI